MYKRQELTISTFGEFGMPDTPFADNVMHAMLVTPAGFAPVSYTHLTLPTSDLV